MAQQKMRRLAVGREVFSEVALLSDNRVGGFALPDGRPWHRPLRRAGAGAAGPHARALFWLPCLHGRGLRAGLLDAGRPGRAGHADLRVLPGAGHPVFQRAFFGKSAAVSAAENLSIGSAPSRE